jgi:hypothetical protein
MHFLGIETNPDKTYTIALMDKNRNITSISNFWREGLLWFLDHQKTDVIAVNLPEWYSPIQQKNALDLLHILTDIFEYKEGKEKISEDKIVVKTDSDMFFSQVVRKDLLPITTREGIEQRIYNLPKAGIKVQKELFSKDRNTIQRELGAIASAFTEYSTYHGNFNIIQKENEIFHIPIYRYIPKDKR